MQTHSGKYKLKNPDKYRGNIDEVVYRSSWEKYAFIWADSNTNIEKWSSEEEVIPYFYEADKRYHRYFCDLWIRFKDGKTFLVEIKPHKETLPPNNPGRKTSRFITESLTYIKNQNKWKAAKKYAEDRQWEFVVWTENELMDLGILPKRIRPLKQMKGLKKLSVKKK